jgi:hypothetical protein
VPVERTLVAEDEAGAALEAAVDDYVDLPNNIVSP